METGTRMGSCPLKTEIPNIGYRRALFIEIVCMKFTGYKMLKFSAFFIAWFQPHWIVSQLLMRKKIIVSVQKKSFFINREINTFRMSLHFIT